VAVRLQRHRYGGVSEAVAHDLRMDPQLKQVSRVGVPKVVEADGGEPGSLQGPLEGVHQAVG
jgi:hypothetical protein